MTTRAAAAAGGPDDDDDRVCMSMEGFYVSRLRTL